MELVKVLDDKGDAGVAEGGRAVRVGDGERAAHVAKVEIRLNALLTQRLEMLDAQEISRGKEWQREIWSEINVIGV